MHGESNGASGRNGNGSTSHASSVAMESVGLAPLRETAPVSAHPMRERVAHPETLPAAGTDELELWEIAAALRRRVPAIVLFAFLGLLCGVFAGLAAKKRYSSTATVEFAQPSVRALGLQDPSFAESDVSTLELLNTELKTQEAEIKDDDTALAVIEQLHLDRQAPFAIPAKLAPNDPLGRERGLALEQAPHERERVIQLFGRQLAVDVVKGTRLLNITYTDTDPERAAAVANAVVAASMDQTAGRRHQAFSQVSGWLSDQLAALKGRVEDSQRRAEAYENANQKDLAGMTLSPLAATAQEQRSVMSGPSDSVPVARLLALNSQLTNAQVARLSKEAIFRVAESGDQEAILSLASSSLMSGGGADSPLSPGNNGLALLQHLREQAVQAQVGIAATGTKYGEKSQTMVELRRQQTEIDAQMKAELHRLRERAHDDLLQATEAEAGLRRQVSDQQNEVSQWTSKADHLLILQGEAASNRALYQDLFAKLQESQFAAGIRASHVAVLDPARVPTSPSSPHRAVEAGTGMVIGTLLGFVLAFALELLDRSLHSEVEVRKILHAPVLASIPRVRGKGVQEPWVVAEPRSQIAEAYRGLRARVFPVTGAGVHRVLLVASARPAEGKATTCLNAAAALALQGHRVLIVNADMRREAQTGPLEGQGFGLSTYLAGRHALPEVLTQPVQGMSNLALLPAGPAASNAAELLGSSRLRELMRTLRGQFEYILIDTPPALLFSDARVLMPYADEYVLVVRASHTLREDLRRTAEELRGAGAEFLGVWMTSTRARRTTYAKFGYGV